MEIGNLQNQNQKIEAMKTSLDKQVRNFLIPHIHHVIYTNFDIQSKPLFNFSTALRGNPLNNNNSIFRLVTNVKHRRVDIHHYKYFQNYDVIEYKSSK